MTDLRPATPATSVHRPAVAPIAALGVIAVLIALDLDAVDHSPTYLAWTSIPLSTFCIWLIGLRVPGGLWSFEASATFVLAVFNFGAFLPYLYGGDAAFQSSARFIDAPELGRAVGLSMIAMCAFTIGILVASPGDRRQSKLRLRVSHRAVSTVGSVVLIISSLSWMRFAFGAGLGFGSSYADYLESAAGTPLQSMYFLISLSLAMAVVDLRSKLTRLALVAFALFVAVAFPLGLRGEVLFAVVVAGSVLALTRKMPRWWVTIALVVLLLMPVAIVSETRQETRTAAAQEVASPVRALGELGGSIGVVTETVRWHDTQREAFANGRTYWAPTRDAFVRFVLRRPVGNTSRDPDYMATKISERVGNIGGSIVGEAYHNYGSWGVFWILLAWGLLLSRAAVVVRASGAGLMLVICVAAVFQALVRNSFASAPVLAFYALMLTAVTLVVAAAFRSQERKQDGAS